MLSHWDWLKQPQQAKEYSQLSEDKNWKQCLLASIAHQVKKPLRCTFELLICQIKSLNGLRHLWLSVPCGQNSHSDWPGPLPARSQAKTTFLPKTMNYKLLSRSKQERVENIRYHWHRSIDQNLIRELASQRNTQKQFIKQPGFLKSTGVKQVFVWLRG